MNEITGGWADSSDANAAGERYVLQLYVTGASGNSLRAVTNLKAVCEQYLAGRYDLEVIDIHQQGEAAAAEQILALPVLIRRAPLPQRRLIGDMSDTQKYCAGSGSLSILPNETDGCQNIRRAACRLRRHALAA